MSLFGLFSKETKREENIIIDILSWIYSIIPAVSITASKQAKHWKCGSQCLIMASH